MNSKIKKLLCLKDGGRKVAVRGPITDWEPDEESAVVSVVIAQVKADGTTAVATGASGQIPNGATGWALTATVAADAPPLEYGPATAAAAAMIFEDSGAIEPYTWTLITRLVHCDHDESDDEEGEGA